MAIAEHHKIFHTGFSTPALSMDPHWRIRFLGPREDLDRIYDEIIKYVPLPYGETDRNAILAAEGMEYYRPMEGAPTGAEPDTRKRPGVFEMWLCIPPDEKQLEIVLNTIYEFHSYYEPPVTVEPVLRSSTRGLDDSKNPHRWWNKDGDWKKS